MVFIFRQYFKQVNYYNLHFIVLNQEQVGLAQYKIILLNYIKFKFFGMDGRGYVNASG
jgi:hypothetical protein